MALDAGFGMMFDRNHEGKQKLLFVCLVQQETLTRTSEVN